jgi:hypothetical protein
MIFLDLIPEVALSVGTTGYANSPPLFIAICFGFNVFETFELFLYLYHQYSKANVKQANPIPTNMTMKTPPVVNKNGR